MACACVAAFFRLDREPVHILNEAREGVFAREMIRSGNWILPEIRNHVENGQCIPDKPPLQHWIGAIVTWVRALATGRAVQGRQAVSALYDAWSLRIPSALAGCLTVAGILLIGRRWLGRRASVLAAAVLVTSWQFVNEARFGRVDMMLACFTTWTMLLAGDALLRGSSRSLILAGATAGLAVLSKGPIGLLLPAAACVLWAAIETGRTRSSRPRREEHPLRGRPWIRATLLFACVALPWYVAAWRLGGRAFLDSQLRCENLDQLTGANGRMSATYYLGPWLGDSLPWNLLAIAGVVTSIRAKDRRGWFLASWWIVFLLVFEVSAYKRGAYLLPALPAGSLLAGLWLDRRLEVEEAKLDRMKLGRWSVRFVGAALAAAILGAWIGGVSTIREWTGLRLPPSDFALAFGGLMATLLALVVAGRCLVRREASRALVALLGGMFALYVGGFTSVLAGRAEPSNPEPLVARIEAEVPPREKLAVVGVGDDPSLLLLFHARDPERFAVLPDRAPRPTRWPSGYYLFSVASWETQASRACDRGGGWHEILRDELRERGQRIPVVLAVRDRPE
jgi:4-amino-4-deoxy-L-arabinose transferase-like glycosyltransferase